MRWWRSFRDTGDDTHRWLDRVAIVWLTRGRRGGYAYVSNGLFVSRSDHDNP